MYLLYAPKEKFGLIPPKFALITDEVLFTHNIAYCPKQFWQKLHLLMGCRDVSPNWMRRAREKRILSNVCVFATGGIGDSLWVMPFVRAVKEKYPAAKIIAVVDNRAAPVWHNTPFIAGIVDNTFYSTQSLVRGADEVWDFGGVATIMKKEKRLDPVEAIFKIADWPLPKEKEKCRPTLVITIDEGQRAQAELGRLGISVREDSIFTIALETSTPNRNWPFEYMKELTKSITALGKKVIWLGESAQYDDRFLDTETKNIGAVNLVGKTNLRQAMSIIALSDVVISCNTGLLVIATALNIPTIGLFGAFNPNIRAKFYERFEAIWGRVECSPCEEHWTECRKGNIAPCMKIISPVDVFNRTMALHKQYPRFKIGKLPIE
jgi:ADP-heptose:LPS heptosyltransferase